MEYSNGYAEQCKNWSERFAARLDGYAAHAAAQAEQAPARSQPPGPPRLPDHAVHAVWQTTLPLCDWARPWPQVLSLGEPRGETPPAHLCAPGNGGAGAAAGGPVADVSCALGRAVRDRLRVAHAPRQQLASSHAVGQPNPGGVSDRRDRRRSAGRQHAGTGPERRLLAQAATGGDPQCTRR
jgi:hypothetical protein